MTPTRDRQRDADVARMLGWTVQPWIGTITGAQYFHLVDPQGNIHGADEAYIAYDSEAQAWNNVPRFSTDDAAAMIILDHLRSLGFWIQIDLEEPRYNAVTIIQPVSKEEQATRPPWGCAEDEWSALDDTLPKAIVRAALGAAAIVAAALSTTEAST